MLATVGYAAGSMILKRHLADLDPRAAAGASLAVAAIVLTPLAAVQAPTRAPSTGALGAVVALGLICTAMAFVLMAMLIGEIGPGRAVVITYVNPIIAVALGVTLLGEQPGAGAIAGLLLILAGSWLSTDERAATRAGGGGPAPARAPSEIRVRVGARHRPRHDLALRRCGPRGSSVGRGHTGQDRAGVVDEQSTMRALSWGHAGGGCARVWGDRVERLPLAPLFAAIVLPYCWRSVDTATRFEASSRRVTSTASPCKSASSGFGPNRS